MATEWTPDGLKEDGFGGFVPIERGSVLAPSRPGVYVVLRVSMGTPQFEAASRGGWFKHRNPTVSREVLSAKWVKNAAVVYIGQSSNLRKRIRQLRQFGEGKAWAIGAADTCGSWRIVPS